MTNPFDPRAAFRSPSRRGEHPHTLRSEDEDKNPQVMYEDMNQPGPPRQRLVQRPMGAPPQQKSLLEHPLVMIGIGGLLAYALYKLTENDEPRRNPEPQPQTLTAPIVAVIPQTLAAPAALPTFTDPLPAAAKALEARVESKPVEVKRRKTRTRKTTQARDPVTKKFLAAGTRRRAITEGKKERT